MAKLTVVVIAYNEEQNIGNTLESVKFADEIIIVDSFSDDKTVEISRQFTDKIFEREFDDFSSQRNYALSLATNEWIFVIDSDELVTPELKNEIEFIVSNKQPKSAYSIGRNNIFMGKRTRFSGVQNDRVVRLFPSHVRYNATRVHETPNVKGVPIKRLKGRIEHLTYKNYEAMLNKIDQYSTLKAMDMYDSGYNPAILKMIFKPIHRFLRHYIAQGGFLDGKRGFIIAYIRALEVFQRLTKTWRMQEGEKIISLRK